MLSCTLAIFGMFVTIYIQHLKIKQLKLEYTQARNAFEQCQLDMHLSNEVTNEYESKITDLNVKLRDLRRLYSTARIKINHSTVFNNATSTEKEFCRQNGIDASELIDYSEDAERTRLKLLGCQSFLKGLEDE